MTILECVKYIVENNPGAFPASIYAEARAAIERAEAAKEGEKTCLLTECEINVFITSKMRDEQPELTQELFDDVELALHTCHTIARNIREKYPFMRVEVRP